MTNIVHMSESPPRTVLSAGFNMAEKKRKYIPLQNKKIWQFIMFNAWPFRDWHDRAKYGLFVLLPFAGLSLGHTGLRRLAMGDIVDL